MAALQAAASRLAPSPPCPGGVYASPSAHASCARSRLSHASHRRFSPLLGVENGEEKRTAGGRGDMRHISPLFLNHLRSYKHGAKPFRQGTLLCADGAWLFATPARHVCHAGAARLPCRRGTFAVPAWQTTKWHLVMGIYVAKTVSRHSVTERRDADASGRRCFLLNRHSSRTTRPSIYQGTCAVAPIR